MLRGKPIHKEKLFLKLWNNVIEKTVKGKQQPYNNNLQVLITEEINNEYKRKQNTCVITNITRRRQH